MIRSRQVLACAFFLGAAGACSAPRVRAPEAWDPGNLTSAEDYGKGRPFRFLVTALRDGPAMMERAKGDRIAEGEAYYYVSRLRSLIDSPQDAVKYPLVSASLIGAGRTTTYRGCGLILSAPAANVVAAQPFDMGSQRRLKGGEASEEEIRAFQRRYGIAPPQRLLAETPPGEYNEVLLRGVAADGGRLKVSGFFAKTDAGRPRCSPEMFRILSEAARSNRLPLALIEDEPVAASASNARPPEPAPDGAVPPPPSRAAGDAASAKAGISWVKIPAGNFLMGEEGSASAAPVHRVTIEEFEMARSPVTNRQYRACVAAGACTPPHDSDGTCDVLVGEHSRPGKLPASFQGDDQPVVCVLWAQARAFSRWVGGRLPSESEWEYAARSAGKEWKYPWGSAAPTCERAVIDDGGRGCGGSASRPVCSKPEGDTAQGLCDMAGNVWEWVRDIYHPTYAGAPPDGRAWQFDSYLGDADDGIAWYGGGARVRRGGSWDYPASASRAANRAASDAQYRGDSLGFRPVRSRRASDAATGTLEIRKLIGPFALRGVNAVMEGPSTRTFVDFPGPGWITGYKVHVLDARGALKDDLALLCHAALRDPETIYRGNTPEIDGVRSIGSHLTTTEGANEVRLPEGFGVWVDTSAAYAIDAMLQSPNGGVDGDYTFDARIDFRSGGETPGLKTLTTFRVDANIKAPHRSGGGEWDVPPGRHSYENEFGPPRDVVVHMIDFHFHRYVASVELLDAGTGAALYAADVKTRADGYPVRPVYSSVDGFPLARGRRYLFRVTYDNPTGEPVEAMATAYLYVADSAAGARPKSVK